MGKTKIFVDDRAKNKAQRLKKLGKTIDEIKEQHPEFFANTNAPIPKAAVTKPVTPPKDHIMIEDLQSELQYLKGRATELDTRKVIRKLQSLKASEAPEIQSILRQMQKYHKIAEITYLVTFINKYYAELI